MTELTYTALITPFLEDGSVDNDTLLRLAKRQIDAGIDGVVFAGSTGEGFTLCSGEYKTAIRELRTAFPQLELIAGVSAVATRTAKLLARYAQDAGASQIMLGMSPYVLPNQQGMEEHMVAVARNVDIPVILYNVPGRTQVDLEPETAARAKERAQNIYAIKEASKSVNRVEAYHENDMRFLLGNDIGVQGGMVMGADGLVSVSSNLVPRRMRDLVSQSRLSPTGTLLEYNRLSNLLQALACESNPRPVKYAASEMGLCQLIYRSPQTPPSDDSQRRILNTLRSYNLVRTEPITPANMLVAN